MADEEHEHGMEDERESARHLRATVNDGLVEMPITILVQKTNAGEHISALAFILKSALFLRPVQSREVPSQPV
jgi:hypothetical protein